MAGQVADWKPTIPGAVSSTVDGEYEVFPYVLDSGLRIPLYATLLGGSGGETVSTVTVADDATVFVLGHTDSQDFPVSARAFARSHHGGDDVFIVSLQPLLGR